MITHFTQLVPVNGTTITKSSTQSEASRKVTAMCLTIASLFSVCWLPYQLDLTFLVYGNQQVAMAVQEDLKIMTWINSCLNPIIYGLMWRPFRTALRIVSRTVIRFIL